MNGDVAFVSDEMSPQIPDQLRSNMIKAVLHHRQFGSGAAYRCTKNGVSVLLSLDKPPHWAFSRDER